MSQKTQGLDFFNGLLLAFLCPFRRLMPVNRVLKAARVPCAPFAALEAKRHHHPQLAQRCISAACAAFRACHQLRLLMPLRFYCRAHELSNNQQEAGSRYSSG
jgi:hypothetical protein